MENGVAWRDGMGPYTGWTFLCCCIVLYCVNAMSDAAWRVEVEHGCRGEG